MLEKMMGNDHFSQWLGIEVAEIITGRCSLRMRVRRDMLNGFGIAHGGILFSLADSALAFASNSHNRLSLSLNASVSYPASCTEGDVLVAEAAEISLANKSGVYDVTVRRERDDAVIALFRGMVYRTSKPVLEE